MGHMTAMALDDDACYVAIAQLNGNISILNPITGKKLGQYYSDDNTPQATSMKFLRPQKVGRYSNQIQIARANGIIELFDLKQN